MNKVHTAVSECRSEFEKMCYGLTTDKNKVDDAVQELMLYFLQMNPETLKGIYDRDGKKGLIRYGAVALRRSLTSPRSAYYYKYDKYYTRIDGASVTEYDTFCSKHITKIPNPEDDTQHLKLESIDKILDNMYWYDRDVFKLYYYEGKTLSGLAEETGISRNSLFTTIDKVRNIIKKELE